MTSALFEDGTGNGVDRLIADRIAVAFREHGAGRFSLATRGTRIENRDGSCAYRPDLVLFDGNSEIHTIVELDASDDRGDGYSRRADCYRAIPSLQNYLIVRTEKPQITWFSRVGERQWLFGAADDVDASARLEMPPVTLKLAELYEGVLTADARSV